MRSSASTFLFHASDFFHASNVILIAACSSLIYLPIVRSSPLSSFSTGFARSLARVAARVVAYRPPPAVSIARSIELSVISWFVWFRRDFADGFRALRDGRSSSLATTTSLATVTDVESGLRSIASGCAQSRHAVDRASASAT
ncbi:hypothetical protein CABS03_02014 [Colletotrichum abscissum]|uniref:Uncharacterized protein n=1 Tax=Colletotrichum abscissum TaxID=1671311 RepID=A0A9P9X052_9PEZI|nr:hypothetical protein CABS02_14985 [Colletotrichum abscissum]